MKISNVFRTSTGSEAPFDGSAGTSSDANSVSDFLTVQSLTNFAAMTGAISAAWGAITRLDPDVFSGLWFPYLLAGLFGVVSILISMEALKNAAGRLDPGKVAAAVFIAAINALILAGAVVGTTRVVSPPTP